MARIPRISFQRPSAIPGTSPGAATIGGELADLASNLADLTASGADILSGEERKEALKLRAITEAKQQIINEVEASKRNGDFELDLFALDQQVREDFQDVPGQAVEEFVRRSRDIAESEIQAAPNSEVGLSLARGTASRIVAGTRRLQTWVSTRQTQKAKNDLDVLSNRVTRGAENRVSPEDLTNFLITKQAELTPTFNAVWGKQAGAKMSKLLTDSAEAYVLANGEQDPIGMLNQLDAKKGPLVDLLSSADRVRLRKDTQRSLEGIGKTREREIVQTNVELFRDTYEAFLDGSLDAGRINGIRNAAKDKIGATRVNPKFTPQQRETQIKLLEKELEFLDAIESIRRRQLPYDATDDISTVRTLLQTQNDLFKANNGKKGRDLLLWQDQQLRLTLAYRDKKISQGTYNTLFKGLTNALPKAIETEPRGQGVGGFFRGVLGIRTPREVGNITLDNRFDSGQFREISDEVKTQVQITYYAKINAIVEGGGALTEEGASRAALQALSIETRTQIPGAFD